MKTQFFTIMLFSSVLAYSQVGIDTETPKATLDVVGKPTDLTKIDGLIAPRLKGSELKAKDALCGADQKASLVYVSEALAASDTTAKTINVTSIGYFYFDGNIWQKLNDGNTGNAGNNWSLLGNSGTTAGTNFIGTTDAVDFVVKTNNIERERIYKEANINNTIKTISGGDLNITGITVGKGKNNNPDNTVFGVQGLFSNTTGTFNTGMGAYALKSNTTGTSNVAIGHSSLISNTEGGTNVGLGASTLVYNQTGSNNIAIGLSALSNISNTDGNHNIGIGFTAGNKLENGTSNNIVIGSKQNLATSTASNQLNIGGAIFGTGLTGTESAPAGNIGIGTTTPATRLEVNNGTTNGAIKIVDGTQGEGKILTSDVNGVGTWQDNRTKTIIGQNANAGYDLPFEVFSEYRYTGASITLPPGKWLVMITQLAKIEGTTTANDWLFIRTTFSDENLTTVGQAGVRSADIGTAPVLMSFTVNGQSWFNAYSGSVLINNTSGGNKTYRYIAGDTVTNSPPPAGVNLNNFGGNWAENSITAIAIN